MTILLLLQTIRGYERLGIAVFILREANGPGTFCPGNMGDSHETIFNCASLTHNRIILLSTHIISDVEAVANRLMILQEGRVLVDTTPEALLARTAGSVWSVTTDQATAMQLQATYQVSTMVNQMNGITLRIVSATRPHEAAVVSDPSLEEAYLLAVGRPAFRV